MTMTMPETIIKCMECGRELTSEKGLHLHLRAHKIKPTEYYFKYYGKVSLATGEPIVFEGGLENYRKTYFNSRKEMRSYFKKAAKTDTFAKGAATIMLRDYMDEKSSAFIPCEFESMTCNCPSTSVLKKFNIDIAPYLFVCDPAPKIKLAKSYFVDTREQNPFEMEGAVKTKLDIGDYTAAGKYFENVFCDRKSGNDFVSSFTSGFERFKREVERAVQSDAFLYIVIESNLASLYKKSVIFKRQGILELALHNSRALLREYPNRIQFILAGDRLAAEKATKYVLSAGKAGTRYDYQYLINNELEPWN